MSHLQHPIGSGFTAASTADEVLAGIDLAGKNIVVTGGHAGLGLETTRALAKAGASVTVGARDPDRAARALAGLECVFRSTRPPIPPAPSHPFRSTRPRSERSDGIPGSSGPTSRSEGTLG